MPEKFQTAREKNFRQRKEPKKVPTNVFSGKKNTGNASKLSVQLKKDFWFFEALTQPNCVPNINITVNSVFIANFYSSVPPMPWHKRNLSFFIPHLIWEPENQKKSTGPIHLHSFLKMCTFNFKTKIGAWQNFGYGVASLSKSKLLFFFYWAHALLLSVTYKFKSSFLTFFCTFWSSYILSYAYNAHIWFIWKSRNFINLSVDGKLYPIFGWKSQFVYFFTVLFDSVIRLFS